MKVHIASVHEGNKPFQCNICDASFVEKRGLNRHVASVHEKKKPFQCSICNYGSAEKSKLKGHIASVHEGIRPFQCNICDASFVGKGDLNRHVASVHEKKRVACTLCNRTYPYSKKYTLKKHMLLSHGVSESQHPPISNDNKMPKIEDLAPESVDCTPKFL